MKRATKETSVPLIRLQIVREKEVQYLPCQTTPDDVVSLFRSVYGHPDRELAVAYLLDGKNRVIATHTVSEGTLSQSMVAPREVFKLALLTNTAAIVIAHNHPTGDPQPSSEDIQVTKRLKEAGDLLGVKLLDHIILGDDDNYVSLAARGVL